MPPARREPEWSDETAHRASLDWINARPIPLSGNPLLNLTTQDVLAYLGTAFGLKASDLARALAVSRETLYRSLQRAQAEIEPAAERSWVGAASCAEARVRRAGCAAPSAS